MIIPPIRRFSDDLLRSWTPDELLKFALYSKKHGAINFQPGARYEYSDTNTLLLAKVVELKTGRQFSGKLNAAILRSSSLGSTVYVKGASLPAPHALGIKTSITIGAKRSRSTRRR